MPEEAASAQVLVGRRESGQLDDRRKAWGEQLENGVWLFWLESGEEMHDEMALSQADRALERWTYELILHRGDGSVLLTQSGQLPGKSGLRIQEPGRFCGRPCVLRWGMDTRCGYNGAGWEIS